MENVNNNLRRHVNLQILNSDNQQENQELEVQAQNSEQEEKPAQEFTERGTELRNQQEYLAMQARMNVHRRNDRTTQESDFDVAADNIVMRGRTSNPRWAKRRYNRWPNGNAHYEQSDYEYALSHLKSVRDKKVKAAKQDAATAVKIAKQIIKNNDEIKKLSDQLQQIESDISIYSEKITENTGIAQVAYQAWGLKNPKPDMVQDGDGYYYFLGFTADKDGNIVETWSNSSMNKVVLKYEEGVGYTPNSDVASKRKQAKKLQEKIDNLNKEIESLYLDLRKKVEDGNLWNNINITLHDGIRNGTEGKAILEPVERYANEFIKWVTEQADKAYKRDQEQVWRYYQPKPEPGKSYNWGDLSEEQKKKIQDAIYQRIKDTLAEDSAVRNANNNIEITVDISVDNNGNLVVNFGYKKYIDTDTTVDVTDKISIPTNDLFEDNPELPDDAQKQGNGWFRWSR